MVNQLQQSKLAYLAQKLGFDLRDTQQTHRRVYDTLDASAAGIYEFFSDFAGKTLAQTNLSSGKLDSSEAFVIKQIGVNGRQADNIGLNANLLSVVVGGQTVVKKLPLQFFVEDELHFEQITKNTKIGTVSGTVGQGPNLRLLTNIVVPPQVEFKIVLQTAGLVDPTVCYLDGFGVIFNPQMSL